MKLELTPKQVEQLHMAILTRIRTVEKLLEGWVDGKDKDSTDLFERYSLDLRVLREMEKKVI
jgi:hypothetical protein